MVWSVPGDQRPFHGGVRGVAVRLRRPQRRRQDDDDALDIGSAASRFWPDYVERHARAQGSSSLLRLSARRTRTLSHDGGPGALALPGTFEWWAHTGCWERPGG